MWHSCDIARGSRFLWAYLQSKYFEKISLKIPADKSSRAIISCLSHCTNPLIRWCWLCTLVAWRIILICTGRLCLRVTVRGVVCTSIWTVLDLIMWINNKIKWLFSIYDSGISQPFPRLAQCGFLKWRLRLLSRTRSGGVWEPCSVSNTVLSRLSRFNVQLSLKAFL